MLLKSFQLNKNLLQSSKHVLNSLNVIRSSKTSHLTCSNSTFSTSSSAQQRLLLTGSFLEKNLFFLNNARIHTSIIANQANDGSKPPTKAPTATKSNLSEDLKNIMAQKFGEDEQTGQNLNKAKLDTNKEQGEEKQGRFASIFSREHAWKVSLTFLIAMFGGSFIYILLEWGAPKLDENKQPIEDQFSSLPIFIQYPKRALNAVFNYYEMMKEPSTDKLLPEPIQPPYYQPPYTLVIEMSGILLHPEWTFSTGWRYKKRPGLDYFIDQIKYPLFEVVLFTKEPFLSGAPIVASLDPQNQIQFKLFRESTKFINNNYVKDLSYMNRDIKKIIVIDWDENAYNLQPRNALHRLKKWEGDDKDTDLVYLATFLKMIAASGVEDVREVLDYYNKEVDPLGTFKLNQVKLQEAENQRQLELEQLKEKQKKSPFSFFKR